MTKDDEIEVLKAHTKALQEELSALKETLEEIAQCGFTAHRIGTFEAHAYQLGITTGLAVKGLVELSKRK